MNGIYIFSFKMKTLVIALDKDYVMFRMTN